MSWLRSAVNKAVEVGNKNNLTRTVKNYADSVVHHAGQAVAEGAKIFQDRITVKRLEEASVSCRGRERVELMRRWVAVLKEIEKSSGITFEDKETSNEQHQLLEDPKESPRRQSMVLYYDPDTGGEPMTFRDVFLYSQALEGISICMVKREELLQFAEGAITGLKVNADLQRIDAEVSTLKKQLELRASQEHGDDGHRTNLKQSTAPTIEALKEALAHIRVCSRLEGLLLKKKALKYGDTTEIHSQKVDKLKVLSESLASSSSKAEKRISDNRLQKEDALKFRVSKASEVSEIEKELAAEISGLEKQREELEAQLMKVNTSLSAAQARLRNVTEERDQFFEANDQIVAHLKTKKELRPSIDRIGKYVENLKSLSEGLALTSEVETDDSQKLNPRRNLEEEYRDYEAKIITTFSVVDNMREQFYAEQGKNSSKENLKVKELFDNIEKLREEFESIERPNLEIENPTKEKETSSGEKLQESVRDSFTEQAGTVNAGKDDDPQPPPPKSEQMLDPEAELAKLESEFGKINQDYSTEEIGEWEFDELERELRSGDSSKK
ncbi:hypothetical protein DH2020_030350 [Rehmannia glutinosa]|uniref:Uncharacterized protein n=1 Tax=Rehmannia glutinosa TaxID=99300 RepID=A0ABR0VL01_REHGL